MQVTSVLKAGLVAAVVGFAGTAAAVPLNGSVNVQGPGFADTGPLTGRSVFAPAQAGTFGISSGNFSGFAPLGSAVSISAFDTSTASGGLTLSFGGSTFVSSSVLAMPAATATTADFFFLGTLTSATQGAAPAGFQVSPVTGVNASFRASLSRNGVDPNFTVSFSGVLAAPPATGPVPVPEPASMALLGMGLLGLGLARRKKAN